MTDAADNDRQLAQGDVTTRPERMRVTTSATMTR
jgi:hypothetical protein